MSNKDIQDSAARLEDNEIYENIVSYYRKIVEDEYHRFKSWEHCYQYFSSDDNFDVDIASLHLAFYLASWGMYRGSSFLIWKDYKVHKEVVKKVINHKNLQNIDFMSISNDSIEEIIELSESIRNGYCKNSGKTNVTDTLVTKIMLGTLGCVPAFDSFCIMGMRKLGLSYSKKSKKNLQTVIDFYQKNCEQFKKVCDCIDSKGDVNYPTMKLVDMYFWQIGQT